MEHQDIFLNVERSEEAFCASGFVARSSLVPAHRRSQEPQRCWGRRWIPVCPGRAAGAAALREPGAAGAGGFRSRAAGRVVGQTDGAVIFLVFPVEMVSVLLGDNQKAGGPMQRTWRGLYLSFPAVPSLYQYQEKRETLSPSSRGAPLLLQERPSVCSQVTAMSCVEALMDAFLSSPFCPLLSWHRSFVPSLRRF